MISRRKPSISLETSSRIRALLLGNSIDVYCKHRQSGSRQGTLANAKSLTYRPGGVLYTAQAPSPALPSLPSTQPPSGTINLVFNLRVAIYVVYCSPRLSILVIL